MHLIRADVNAKNVKIRLHNIYKVVVILHCCEIIYRYSNIFAGKYSPPVGLNYYIIMREVAG